MAFALLIRILESIIAKKIFWICFERQIKKWRKSMITLDSLDDCEFKEPIFVEKFDESEPYNEKEEDITN